jgi:hypothetical protein
MLLSPLVLSLCLATGIQADTLSAVDLYGLRTVSEATVREAVGLRPRDPVPDSIGPIVDRLQAIPGVAEADVSRVCCAEDGGTMLYVGIREDGTPALTYRAAPTGTARLTDDIVAMGLTFDTALYSAVRRGVTAEDHSRGYALSSDSAVRAVQDRFVDVAAQRMELLRTVLRTSADAEHRALAAYIIAYGADRNTFARDLLYAVDDPDNDVRNNAVRALAVLRAWANQHPEAGIDIPADAFIDFLISVSWTDRNKGVFALMSLTASGDPALLSELRTRALPSLVEMARWTNPGHAFGPFLILARIAGVEEAKAFEAWQAGDRETVIAEATASVP